MKKVVFVFAAMCFITPNIIADTCHTVQRDKVRNNYKDVKEEGSTETGLFLRCENQGDKECQFSDGECAKGTIVGDIEDYVQDQLTHGVHSGSGTLEGVEFSWTPYGDTGYTLVVNH